MPDRERERQRDRGPGPQDDSVGRRQKRNFDDELDDIDDLLKDVEEQRKKGRKGGQ